MLRFGRPAARGRRAAANEARAGELRERIGKEKLAKDLVRARIKADCWESVEHDKKEVGGAGGEIPLSPAVERRTSLFFSSREQRPPHPGLVSTEREVSLGPRELGDPPPLGLSLRRGISRDSLRHLSVGGGFPGLR